jgi:hypothetical protein
MRAFSGYDANHFEYYAGGLLSDTGDLDAKIIIASGGPGVT